MANTTTSSNTKRIAKNSLMLYFRMILLILISLYISRVVLDVLGIEDYGIYNVVGGFVAMFAIISGSMSVTISRFITYELGKGSQGRLSTVFSTSIMIQLVMAVVVCLMIEGVGVWFLNAKMNISPERMWAANWVLHASAFSFMLNLVYTPYNALIIAYERMSAFAYISIFEAFLKLSIVFILSVVHCDKLILYALLNMIVSVMMFLLYQRYCKKHFPESKFRWVRDNKLIKEMFGLIGWAFWGNGAVVLKDQGTNVVLNLFCGPAVNAARGVALQVNSAVYSFTSNFLAALNPQITKSYSSGNLNYMHSLITTGSKYAFFILTLMFLPLCANVDFVLDLWLTEVPAHTSAFIVLTLLYSLFDCFGNPVLTGVLAEGNIRNYEIALTILYVLNLVVSYFLLDWGFAPEWVFVAIVVFKIIVVMALLWHARGHYSLSIRNYTRKCLLPCSAVFAISYPLSTLFRFDTACPITNFLLSVMTIVSTTAIVILMVGVTRTERAKGYNYILHRLNKQKAWNK